jgi:predicted nucleic acid-binding protein
LRSSDNCHTLSCVLVFDASTLILLAKSDLLDLFLNDFPGVPLMPGAVEAESTGYPDRPDGVLIRRRLEEGRLTVEEIRQPKVVARLVQDFRLGAGEAEALALALEKGELAVVATDDRNAIRACKVLRVGFVTSLGILVRAVEKNLLTPEDGMRCLERLKSLGRFRAEIIEEVSHQIGGSHGESSEDG